MLEPRITPGSKIIPSDAQSWRLEIPAGPAGQYRLAQLDDYRGLQRRAFPRHAPFSLSLQARASSLSIPGTWGFGLWNDPFSFSIGFGGGRRFPALPQAAWFFFASPANHLSLRDDLPASGALAATFYSPAPSPLLVAAGSLCLPALMLPALGRRLRSLGRRFVHQDTAILPVNPVEWNSYQLDLGVEGVAFYVNANLAFETLVTPSSPLGVVIWLDNQYAAWTPDGRMRYGTLESSEPVYIEIAELNMQIRT